MSAFLNSLGENLRFVTFYNTFFNKDPIYVDWAIHKKNATQLLWAFTVFCRKRTRKKKQENAVQSNIKEEYECHEILCILCFDCVHPLLMIVYLRYTLRVLFIVSRM